MARPWNMALGEVIDASKSMPLYLQIVHGLIHEVERGRLASGVYLPAAGLWRPCWA